MIKGPGNIQIVIRNLEGMDAKSMEAAATGLRRALLAFRDLYNETWLIERHGFRPPAAIRTAQLPPAALAA